MWCMLGVNIKAVLFNIFIISVWSDGAECTLSRFADNRNLTGIIDIVGGDVALFRGTSTMEKIGHWEPH